MYGTIGLFRGCGERGERGREREEGRREREREREREMIVGIAHIPVYSRATDKGLSILRTPYKNLYYKDMFSCLKQQLSIRLMYF